MPHIYRLSNKKIFTRGISIRYTYNCYKKEGKIIFKNYTEGKGNKNEEINK